jgi:3-phenylpropionate/trans-cinnamate dioxygenase ferredoxin reductase component
MTDPIVIIGASHAGVQTAFSLRQGGWSGGICLISEEADIPYHRPPLSKDLLSGTKSAEEIQLRPETAYSKVNIELVRRTKVSGIDRADRLVMCDTGKTFHYSKLVLATGTRPRTLKVPGGDLPGVFHLRSADDAGLILDAAKSAKRAVIIGGGYIGLEVAASLIKKGVEVTLLEAADRILARVTAPVVSQFYKRVHREEGVNIQEGCSAAEIRKTETGLQVLTDRGEMFDADFVLVGIGVVPNMELATDAGLDTGNGIVVNSYCQTSDEDIYAAGDVTWHYCADYDRHTRLESVPNATEQAKTIASHILGEKTPYRSLPWFWSDQFDMKLQIAGLTEGFDGVVLRGDPDKSRSFAAYYFLGDRLLGVDAVNAPRDFMFTRMSLSRGQSVDKAKLSDLSCELKDTLI